MYGTLIDLWIEVMFNVMRSENFLINVSLYNVKRPIIAVITLLLKLDRERVCIRR